MTAEEKTVLAGFLDLSSDYLANGHKQLREEYCFTDDSVKSSDTQSRETAPENAIPLAYLIDEPAESGESDDSIKNVNADICNCKACRLALSRTNAVPGEGSTQPLVMVIGEGPGADEDAAGRPFVGKAGQLLDRMLASISLSRNENCFIANMVKCRPPGNRDPEPGELSSCYKYLERQILLLKPSLILCAGRIAAQNLLKTSKGINALRGNFFELKIAELAIPVLPTFHPSALLRDESLKRPAWEDLKLLKARLASPAKE